MLKLDSFRLAFSCLPFVLLWEMLVKARDRRSPLSLVPQSVKLDDASLVMLLIDTVCRNLQAISSFEQFINTINNSYFTMAHFCAGRKEAYEESLNEPLAHLDPISLGS